MASQTTEDYLKAIYELEEIDHRATTSALAGRLGVAPASVTLMLENLARRGLVSYIRYRGARLSDAGRAMALETIRHHRLLELFLQQELGYQWDEVHAEAERLEHVISEKLEEQMAARLGFPAVDPHGDPIPTRDGRIPASPDLTLADLPEGSRAVVRRVVAQSPETLRYLASVGLVLQARLTIVNKTQLGGAITVRVGEESHALSLDLARSVFVVPVNGSV